MHKIQFMNILNPIKYLRKHLTRLLLTQSILAHYMIKQLPLWRVLHNQIQLFWGFDDLTLGGLPRRAGLCSDVSKAS